MDVSKLSEKDLRVILKLLNSAFEEHGEYPNDGLDFFENYLDIVDEALRYVNFDPQDIEDYSFIGELYFLNKDNQSSNIVRPTLKVFDVYHEEEKWERVTNYYRQAIPSYMTLTKDILYECGSHNMYEYYDGNQYDTEYIDSDWISDEVTEITERKKTVD